MRLSAFLVGFLVVSPAFPATFGTVVSKAGASYADVVLDEPRQRLYLVNSASNTIDVWSTQQRAFLTSIRTDAQPVSIALSLPARSGQQAQFLYVTTYTASSLNIVDLTKATPGVTSRVSLPSSPEGVAVGGDGRVLISTIGNNGQNTLYVYDPAAPATNGLSSVPISPAPPTPPTLPAPSGRAALSYHSKLVPTRDGKYIIGANLTTTGTTNNKVVFVYSTESATVLRSRVVTNVSNVLSVSPDGLKFMAGYTLFSTETLQILAQENIANAPFAFPAGNTSNFNTIQNQGGSIFSPDGTSLFAAFNIAPVQTPAARANVTRLLVNDPDNLLIKLGLQLPENLAGAMAINAAGDTIYAISESGFVILPVGSMLQNPIAQADSQVVLLTNDQCGVTAQTSMVADKINNAGRGRLTASVQSYTIPNSGVAGLGGAGGAGGAVIFTPGGTVIIGGGGVPFPGAGGGTTTVTPAATSSVPVVQLSQTASGATLNFRFNANAARTLGTSAASDFLVQSPEAVNIPANIRVFQNSRDSEARGTIIPVQQNISAGEALMDMVQDTARQRLYIANSGLNQIEVFDMRTQAFIAPIKVGQLPHSIAFGNDGATIYVANTGGESISIVDLDKQQMTGYVKFPAIPVNTAATLITPRVMASSQRGPQVVMSDGTNYILWKVDGNQAIPRTLNANIFGGSNTTTVRTVSAGNPASVTMAATPNGESVLLVTGAGNAYLYDAGVDDYVVGRQIFSTPLSGFIGPVTAGPRGQYFVANSTVLNSSLTPLSSSDVSTGPVQGGTLPGQTTATSTGRPVAAVSAISATTFARFTQPVRATATAAVTDAGMVEIVDAASGQTMRTANTLEGPASTVTGTGRATTNGRGLVVDAAGTTAYMLSATGLQIIPLTPVLASDRPAVNTNGVVNQASYQPAVAPGSLVSIFGRNLGQTVVNSASKLPMVMGGTCVTLNNQPLPLVLTSDGQINAQIPPTLAAGRYPLVVRSIGKQAASTNSTTVTVAKYAPAVFVSPAGQAAIYFNDGSLVTKDHSATRDQDLVIYATGLGATHGGTVTAGQPAPTSPLAVTDAVQVYIGDPRYSQSAMIVRWSGLVPGFIGLNQINVRVPGAHNNGDALPVTLKIGGVTSPSTGPAVPLVALH